MIYISESADISTLCYLMMSGICQSSSTAAEVHEDLHQACGPQLLAGMVSACSACTSTGCDSTFVDFADNSPRWPWLKTGMLLEQENGLVDYSAYWKPMCCILSEQAANGFMPPKELRDWVWASLRDDYNY